MGAKRIKRDRFGYLFILPFFIILILFILYPIVYSFVISFTEWDGSKAPPVFVGFKNYTRLFNDQFFIQSIGNTLLIWVSNYIPQVVFGLGLAVVLTDSKIKGKAFFRWVYFLPNLITMTSIATLFFFIMDWQSGALNQLLLKLGLINEKINWLQQVITTRATISFILWWMWFGYTMIIFMAGIKAIPSERFEAARVDGANRWQIFKYITLPGIRPIMTYQVVTSIIGGLAMFEIPFLITGGTGAPKSSALTMVMKLYNTSFRNYQFGYAATIGVGLFIMVAFFVVLAYKILLRNQVEE